MTTKPDDPLQSPQESDAESVVANPRRRPKRSPLSSVSTLPYRRSNASLSSIFASTTSLSAQQNAASSGESGPATPTATVVDGSVFSPGASTVAGNAGGGRPPSPVIPTGHAGADLGIRDLILRAFAPHVSVLASQDTDELLRHKGIHGGLLELLRPFGERSQGKVTIRDSSGVSRSWDDYGIRFTGVKDGLESPRLVDRRSTDSTASQRNGKIASLLEYKPARLRTGGDVPQVEDVVERHLTFAEEQSGPVEADYISHKDVQPSSADSTSPFYHLYLRRLLSGLPLVPSETFSHPVASVIAISSRSPNPIEELRNLFAASNQGEHRLPQWVHNEFLRYYVLVHDEDYDDITKSMQLFDQMKRHFGLHCHLLRLRSTQCVPSDDGATRLPHPEWLAAGEELSEIVRRESSEDDEDPTPYIFTSDADAIKAFVREMVTQSIIPSMERASATWNDQVASRRRGLSGRFMSLSKRFTTFGSIGGNRNSSMPSMGSGGSNYDSLQGFYRPDAPEAIMRKLADYSMMLRDFKLAQSTYEILCGDFKADKAWRHYAAANEMAAVSTLLATSGLSTKVRVEAVDQYLETAYYSYVTRVGAPYNALRTLVLGIELLKVRGGSALDDAARWLIKALDDRVVGPVGHVLMMERIAACFSERKGVAGLSSGERRRKAGFWDMSAADAWLMMDKTLQAEKCLAEATRLYQRGDADVRFEGMSGFLNTLQEAVKSNRHGLQHLDGDDLLDQEDDERTLVEPLQSEPDRLGPRSPGLGHRKSLSTAAPPSLQTGLAGQTTAFDDPLGAVPSAYQGEVAGSTYPEGTVPSTPLSPHGVDVPGSTPRVSTSGGSKRDDGFE
ncbi:hypothetical protein B0A50_00623 [Salinomyces thailandicus]|uniref:Transport protein particle subunit trs85-2 n=1 Tax=Salinomyces thailandicus TaxID=706561 RepID=A0A4U0UES8_9PEZI|nr:hypothetical protein B0A50_00623 [Salinomyces thailandica]